MNRVEVFEIDSPRIQVKHVSGPITIEPSVDGRTTIELIGSSNRAEEVIRQSEIGAHGHTINVTVAKERRRFGRLIISRDEEVVVHLRIPADATLQVSSVAGDIHLLSACDQARLSTISGDILLRSTSEHLVANSISGDISMDGSFDDLTAKTVSGDLDIAVHHGRLLTTSSVSGDIRIRVTAGLLIDVEAKSLSGNLKSEIPLDAAATSGPAPSALEINGKTVSGDIHISRITA